MKIIKDLRTLNAIAKRFDLEIDRKHKYITKEALTVSEYRKLRSEGYNLTFFDGCFYPFITKEVTK